MLAHISRRRRWYKTLKELDPKTEISQNIRADLLLMLSGIDEDKQLMVRTSVGNVSDFDKIADALVRQHPRIHLNERRSQNPKGRSGEWHGKKKKCHSRNIPNTANLAHADEHEDQHDSDPDDGHDEPTAHVVAGSSDDEDDEGHDEKETIEMGVITPFLGITRVDSSDEESFALLAEAAQDEVAACFARAKA